MKKILKIIFVNRKETENKWWHRLFLVLLCSSSIFIFLVSLLVNIEDYPHNAWIYYEPVKFSLEDGYKESSGKELLCDSILDFNEKNISSKIDCHGLFLPYSESKRYQELYDIKQNSLFKEFGLDKYNKPCSEIKRSSTKVGLSKEDIDCIKERFDNEKSDINYPKYEEALENIAKLKVSTQIDYSSIWNDLLYWILYPTLALILWVIFWDAIIYRSILYVIFGRKQ